MDRMDYLDDIVATVHRDMAAHLGRGKVADYIPALARVDPKNFALAVTTCDGRTAQAGGAHLPFSIQSISKVFTLTLALNKLGANLWDRVGREPSGSRFNSIVQLEAEKGIPRNPLINAGALAITDTLLAGGDSDATIIEIRDFMRRLADDPTIVIDDEVAESEAQTGFRNTSLANFLRANDNLTGPVEDVLKVYFHQCALRMNCRQLARAGLFLAHAGQDPLNHARVTTPFRTKRINAIMMTCGHYDASGDFACRVGLPGKSGVGGGILAIAPRKASICVWSPGLNAQGNSLVGAMALERLSSLTGWSVF
ncbi:MAG TPA: glutaminase [Rhizomicrobium sp.]|nr:glutaminase [Rhizomicrobium sp.]